MEADEYVPVVTEDEKVRDWKIEQMTRLGVFSDFEAAELVDAGVDWHDLERLLLAGWPPFRAADILR